MAITDEALAALRAATRWNPTGARALLALLQEHPEWVMYKEDEFGPLSLLLGAVPHRKEAAPGVEVPYRPEPFPESLLPACRQFGVEWRERRFSKLELAQAIGRILSGSTTSDGPEDSPAA